MVSRRGQYIIWQYWETKGEKPLFVDGLYEIARRNSGAEVIQVTPDTLSAYLPNIPEEILRIENPAHKSDMIRALLLFEYGGMWLDSDAIVLKDLSWLFRLLEQYEFVGFYGFHKRLHNQRGGGYELAKLYAKNICAGKFYAYKERYVLNSAFLSRPKSKILSHYIEDQHLKFPKIKYHWLEVGSDLLTPAYLKYKDSAKIFPDKGLSPIRWNQMHKFSLPWIDAKNLLGESFIVMLNNSLTQDRNPGLTRHSIEESAKGRDLYADIINIALDPNYKPPPVFRRTLTSLLTSSNVYSVYGRYVSSTVRRFYRYTKKIPALCFDKWI